MEVDTSANSDILNSMVNGSFFCFESKIAFFIKLGPKSQNCLFQMTLGAWTNSNILNSFSYFEPVTPSLSKFGAKNQNCLFRMKVGN